MRSIVAPFSRFSSLFVSNVYLLDGGSGARWLVDCGHWSERYQLLAELRATGLRPSDLTGILLTHRHSDHAGNADYLRREYGLQVVAHRADASVLEGQSQRAEMGTRGSLLERALCAFENRYPSRVSVDRVLDHGDTFAGLEVHWLPGHTEGSVFYRHAPTQSLLTGDTLLTARPPLTILREVVPAYDAFSLDLAQSYQSLLAFHNAGHRYENVLAGHGRPIVGAGRERVLRALASHKGLQRHSATHPRESV